MATAHRAKQQPEATHAPASQEGGGARTGLEGLSYEEQRQRTAPGAAGGVAQQGLAGAPMGLPHRGEMERTFGRSFDDVVVHTGAEAEAANAALGSRAYTLGNHVVLGTQSPDRALIAHELAHVVQQGAAGSANAGASPASAGASHEDEADQAAAAALSGKRAVVGGRAPVKPQTWTGGEHKAIGDAAWGAAYEDYASSDALAAMMGPGFDPAPESGVAEPLHTADADPMKSFGDGTAFGGDHARTVKQLRLWKSKGGKTPHSSIMARIEWAAIHHEALLAAAKAHKHQEAGDEAGAREALQVALRHEAFAGHFLQDSFSAGHFNLKPLAWQAGKKGKAAGAANMGKTPYHDFFNNTGMHVAAGKKGKGGGPVRRARALGDGNYAESSEDYQAMVREAQEASIEQVLAVATGKKGVARKKGAKGDKGVVHPGAILNRIPRVDADKLEHTKAADKDWLWAASTEAMLAENQKWYDAAKGSKKARTTASGVKVTGKDLATTGGLQDLFDGEYDGKQGQKAAQLRVVRDLEYLERALEPETAKFFEEAAKDWKKSKTNEKPKRIFLVRELLRALRVRVDQLQEKAGDKSPGWVKPLEHKLKGTWAKMARDGEGNMVALYSAVKEQLKAVH